MITAKVKFILDCNINVLFSVEREINILWAGEIKIWWTESTGGLLQLGGISNFSASNPPYPSRETLHSVVFY